MKSLDTTRSSRSAWSGRPEISSDGPRSNTATDANRFTIRLARGITGRPKMLVYSWWYQGTIGETIIVIGK